MAIQQIEVSNTQGTKGIERVINQGAQKMILDTIQITQYTRPVDSTVRELTANAVDAQTEKHNAICILDGDCTPEDFYIERHGEKYEDSNWDPTYYNKKWLNENNNRIQLTYTTGEGGGFCDTFEILDHGVGVGASRLEGYFQLGYSSKRNTSTALGAYGFGNKVALSTRCNFYTIETAYNGKLFRFNCYSYKIDSIIPKFNLEKSTKNGSVIWKDGNEIFYEETTSKNYTKVIVPVKRHNRENFRSAVKSQLLYFDNVDYKVVDGEMVEDVAFSAKILHDSENLIVADSYQYSKPHIIVVKPGTNAGVCYGAIDFKQLEMQDVYANVGIKCPIRSVMVDDDTGEETVLSEGVEVTPSRESVVWSDHTKEFITQKMNDVIDEASDMISEELDTTDFIEWISKCSNLISNATPNSVLGRIGRFVSLDRVKPKFPGNPALRFNSNVERMFAGYKVRRVSKAYNNKIVRQEVQSWREVAGKTVYYSNTNAVPSRDAYLLHKHGDFILMTPTNETPKFQGNVSKRAAWDKQVALIEPIVEDVYECYNDVVTPDDWKKRVGEDDIIVEKYVKRLSPEESRALNQRVIIRTYHSLYKNYFEEITLVKHEPRLKDLVNYPGTLYYGFNGDKDKIKAAIMFSRLMLTPLDLDTDDTKFILVSQKLKDSVRHFKHIDEFYDTVTNDNVLTASESVVNWYTFERHIDKDVYSKIVKLDSHLENILPKVATTIKKIRAKHTDYLNVNIRGNMNESLLEYFDQVAELQTMITNNEDISSKLVELGADDEIAGVRIYDEDFINTFEALKSFYDQVGHLICCDNTTERENAVAEYLQLKNLNTIQI